jgi:hypothetical protein
MRAPTLAPIAMAPAVPPRNALAAALFITCEKLRTSSFLEASVIFYLMIVNLELQNASSGMVTMMTEMNEVHCCSSAKDDVVDKIILIQDGAN